MASPHNAINYVLMIAEMRRYPQMSYKSDIVVLSGMYTFNYFYILKKIRPLLIPCTFMSSILGLDAGDRKALDQKYKPTEAPPCQFDKEDLRFVLKGNFLTAFLIRYYFICIFFINIL